MFEFFKSLFKKKIPAPHPERVALLMRLFRIRSKSDPMVAFLKDFCEVEITGEMLMQQGAPELMILLTVEQYYALRDEGIAEECALKMIAQHHSSISSLIGEESPECQDASTLFEYVRHAVSLHNHGGRISDDFLRDAIRIVKTYYGR